MIHNLQLSLIRDTMEFEYRNIKAYSLINGRSPFLECLSALKPAARRRVQVRLDRAELGNLGDYRSLQDGVFEMRIHSLGGLRIYFGFDSLEIIVILCGGSKRTQGKDIKFAKKYWDDYLKRRYKNVH